MRLTSFALGFVFAGLSLCSALGQPSRLWGDLQPGPFEVGFTSRVVEDASRSFVGKNGAEPHALRISIWYPASSADLQPMTFETYARHMVKDGRATREILRLGLARLIHFRDPDSLPAGPLDRLLDTPTAVVRGAPVAAGSFPVVLWSPRPFTAVSQSVLSEYLASHGFVVAASEHQGLIRRRPWTMDAQAEVTRHENDQVRDLALLAREAGVFPAANPRLLAVLCWSSGGSSAAYFQMSNAEVDLLISLDALVSDANGLKRIRESPYFQPQKLDVPYVFATAQRSGRDISLYQSTSLATAHLLTFHRLAHGDFSSLRALVAPQLGLPAPSDASRTGFQALSRMTLHYLKAYLQPDARGEAASEPPLDGLPQGFVSVESRTGKPRSWSGEALLARIAEQGVDGLAQEISESQSGTWGDEAVLADLAQRLDRDLRVHDALEVYSLCLRLHPASQSCSQGREELQNSLASGLFNPPQQAAPAVQDSASQEDEIRYEVVHLSGPVHLIRLHRGFVNNLTVSVGPDGLLMVDHDVAELAPQIRQALDEIGAGTPRFLLNTHWHPDHTGGNGLFPQALTIAHQLTRRALTETQFPSWAPEGIGPTPPSEWPRLTFDDSITIHWNGEEIEMVQLARSHTDGDAVVFFKGSKVVDMGDAFQGPKWPTGAKRILELDKLLEAVVERSPPDAVVITGHGSISNLEELKTYRQVVQDTISHLRAQIGSGKSREEILASGLPPRWKDWFERPWEQWLERAYDSLTGEDR
ncbi:MAG TPA: MBL fold metallo-hydrolase [Acidobacteriota bacterium]|nr:MBL fold metallo-hydrolase [Acidobacteriota bacterium]